MSNSYKPPRCWLGMQMAVVTVEGKVESRVATEEDINPECTCTTAIQAFMCPEGHLSECHKGMNCSEAECSHLASYGISEEESHE